MEISQTSDSLPTWERKRVTGHQCLFLPSYLVRDAIDGSRSPLCLVYTRTLMLGGGEGEEGASGSNTPFSQGHSLKVTALHDRVSKIRYSSGGRRRSLLLQCRRWPHQTYEDASDAYSLQALQRCRTFSFLCRAVGDWAVTGRVGLARLAFQLQSSFANCRFSLHRRTLTTTVSDAYSGSGGVASYMLFWPLHCPVGPMVGADCKQCKTALSKTHHHAWVRRSTLLYNQTEKQKSTRAPNALLRCYSGARHPSHWAPCQNASCLAAKTRIFTFHRLKSRAPVTGSEANRARQPQCRGANNCILGTAQPSPTSGTIKLYSFHWITVFASSDSMFPFFFHMAIFQIKQHKPSPFSHVMARRHQDGAA